MNLRPAAASSILFALALLLGLQALAGCSPPSGAMADEADAASLFGTGARAAQSETSSPRECAPNQLGGIEPRMEAPAARNIHRLCSVHLAIGHSPVSKTPLWVAERMTPERSRQGSDTARVSEFYPDPRLAESHRAELGDYRRSGYDRGHLAPSADMPGLEAQHESFSLANIAPQNATLNRGPWADLEIELRRFALRHAETYIVTGVLFEGERLQTTPTGRVYVPTSFWKAVAVPGHGSVVFLAENSERGRPMAIPLRAFISRYRIDPFPALDPKSRAQTIEVL